MIVFAWIKPAWTFPVVLHFWGWPMPIHQFCDLVSYFFAFRLYVALQRRAPGPKLDWEQNAWLLVGVIFGALLGAKVLAWAEAPGLYWALRNDPNFWFGGKTIVGGLLGGWMGIELAKKILRVASSTGDLCVFPLILGICLGRVGCFLTGLMDQTHGIRTSLPWGVDFGDGIPRHPTQIYEILYLLTLGVILWANRARLTVPGQLFRWFMIGYLSFRFDIEFYKPHWTLFGGLSAIQWASFTGVLFCFYSVMKLSESPQPKAQNV